MLGWVIRLLLFFSGTITGWFMAQDEHQYPIMQMMVAIFLFVLVLGVVALWPSFLGWLKGLRNEKP